MRDGLLRGARAMGAALILMGTPCGLATASATPTARTTSTASAPPTSTPRTLRVTGQGRATARPDLAVISLGVTAYGKLLAPTTRAATEHARRLLAALSEAGIASADLQTSRYEVEIQRSDPRKNEVPTITGYRVSNFVRAKVRNLDALGSVLDRAVAAGANEVQGPSFEKEDASREERAALAAAVRSARQKAEEMAAAAGLRLGELLELREGVDARPPSYPMRAMAKVSGDVPVAPGELTIDGQVEALFSLHEGGPTR